MSEIALAKKAARTAAYLARADAHIVGIGAARRAAGHVLEAISDLRDVGIVAAYLPFRTEIDPRPAMLALHGLGYGVCVPVIEGRGRPLRFRAWAPGVGIERGPLGIDVPSQGGWLDPDVLIVPLAAFDARAYRLGYGGGFYDRTLHEIRGRRGVSAFGFAYAAQRIEAVPHEPTDAPLDAVVTEAGVMWAP